MDTKLNSLMAGLLICLIALGFSSLAFSMDQASEIVLAQNDSGDGHDRGKHRGPPPQAIEACQAQSVGDTCTFESPKGDVIQGVCEIMPGNIIACLPDNRPPHGKGKHGGPPPAEEYDN